MPLQHLLWVQKLKYEGKVKITKIPGVPNPTNLGTKLLGGVSIRRPLERCHCYICEGRSGKALKSPLTRSQKQKWSLNSIVGESSGAMKLKQLRTKECKPTVNRHAPQRKQNPNKLQRNAIKQSDVSQTTTSLSTILVTIARSCSRICFCFFFARVSLS